MAKIVATIATSAVTSFVVTLGTMLAVSAMTGGEISGSIPESFNPFSQNSQDSGTTSPSPTPTEGELYEATSPEEEYPPPWFAYNCESDSLSCQFHWAHPNYNIESWEWDFGDGNKTTSEVVSHTYASTGTYEVTLKVVDKQGRTGTYTETVTL
ncbi:MAG: PKD domain-containing protein [Candidatus Colwellbacteria bacterium]|nr:PKD domain-containing protein [Candidatus Colwellbacteria bacterium]